MFCFVFSSAAFFCHNTITNNQGIYIIFRKKCSRADGSSSLAHDAVPVMHISMKLETIKTGWWVEHGHRQPK